MLFVTLLITMTWCGALGGYFLKKASAQDFKENRPALIKWLFIGVVSYGTGAILNIIALRFMPYTVVFPLTSITYIWTMCLSAWLLKEPISARKVAGVAFILTGTVFLVI